jgi:glutamate/tyrosine decarboxylase-like PLP-dependent enzyme
LYPRGRTTTSEAGEAKVKRVTGGSLAEIAEICSHYRLWFHIDGAYGAVGILDPQVRERYKGLERADSLALDPHKWLSVPVECGCALVRHSNLLRDTFSLVPPYLRTEDGRGIGGLPWFSEYGFQQSRGFRALKVWMTLLQSGREGLVNTIRRHNQLARYLAALIEQAPDLEVLAPVTLSIVCFRYIPPRLAGDESALNRLNKILMEEIQAGGQAFITSTVLAGERYALRACIIHYATTEEDLEALINLVQTTGERLVKLVAN